MDRKHHIVIIFITALCLAAGSYCFAERPAHPKSHSQNTKLSSSKKVTNYLYKEVKDKNEIRMQNWLSSNMLFDSITGGNEFDETNPHMQLLNATVISFKKLAVFQLSENFTVKFGTVRVAPLIAEEVQTIKANPNESYSSPNHSQKGIGFKFKYNF